MSKLVSPVELYIPVNLSNADFGSTGQSLKISEFSASSSIQRTSRVTRPYHFPR